MNNVHCTMCILSYLFTSKFKQYYAMAYTHTHTHAHTLTHTLYMYTLKIYELFRKIVAYIYVYGQHLSNY